MHGTTSLIKRIPSTFGFIFYWITTNKGG